MKTITIDNKTIEISDESYEAFKEQFVKSGAGKKPSDRMADIIGEGGKNLNNHIARTTNILGEEMGVFTALSWINAILTYLDEQYEKENHERKRD